MAKRSFDIGKLIKVSNKKIFYEKHDNFVFLSDNRGYVVLQTKEDDILSDLEKRGVELTEKAGLNQIVKTAMNKYQPEEMFSYIDTGICFPYYDHTVGKRKILTMFRDYNEMYSVKLADTAYTTIFKPVMITGGKSKNDPIVMICPDCFGIIMPIMVSRNYVTDQKENIKQLMDYFNTFR